jgi:chromosome segregation ATPase
MYISAFAIVLAACTDNSKQVQELQTLHIQDSLLTRQAQGKDSAITSYVKTLDEIQNNIDSIKSKEKILTLSGKTGEQPHSIVDEIKTLDQRIVWENRRIYQLERKLKKEDKKDYDLQKVIKHLTAELAEKDAQIADLQTKLAQTNASLKTVTQQFDDSITVIHKQREEIDAMRSTINTVYYTIGTEKQLKEENIVTKEGKVIGLGGATELQAGANNDHFTQVDMTKLNAIPLKGKFEKLVTIHPESSYNVSGDTLHIIDAANFWNHSKYLVIIVK